MRSENFERAGTVSDEEWSRLRTLNLQGDRSRRMTRTMLIVSLYQRKPRITVDHICQVFQMSRAQVLRIVRLAGCEIRPRFNQFKPEVAKQVLEMSKSTPRPELKAIASECGCSEAYVSKLERQHGIPRYKINSARMNDILAMSQRVPRPTLKTIAAKFGITPTHVSVLERKAGLGRKAKR